MDCTRYNDLVEPFLDPELDGGSALRHRAAMREHGRWCPDCRERLETTRRIFAHLNTMAREPAPPGFTAYVLARVRAAAVRRNRLHRLRLASAWAVGVVSVAVVSAWLVWKDASAAWLFATLGRVATWWYSWAHDVAATVRHTVPVDMPHATPALWRAMWVVTEACIVQLLAAWFTMTAAGAVLHACTRGHRTLGQRS